MLHELWEDPESEGVFTFCLAGPHGDDARSTLSKSARMTWTVEAASYFEAISLYYAHQGWGAYVSDQAWDHKTYAEHGWE
ncbi:hypothetical protein [uncultured Nocardioides sp.]|uniref:hypothetical protein n=1 Tax=uncultured Nocardioides sp. TaxID=198441 RepID=UPI002616CE12|nr:hypothetical protein [uncultured Nocardioides sp.]